MRRIGGAPSGKSTLLLAPVVVVTNLLKSCEGTFTRLGGRKHLPCRDLHFAENLFHCSDRKL